MDERSDETRVYLPRRCRLCAEEVLLRVRLVNTVPAFARFADFRPDLRDGRVRESSSVAVMPACDRFEFRRAVDMPPARRSEALTPGAAVST